MSEPRILTIAQLYPSKMNIYGDYGNVQVLAKRAKLYGYNTKLVAYESIDDRNELLKSDIVLGGGGQDSGQRAILDDLNNISNEIISLAESGLPMLMICGLYQLFGNYFKTRDGDKLTGIGLFDLYTIGGDRRLIGNIVIDTKIGEVVGYENHSGMTMLDSSQRPFGSVIKGYGNDIKSGREGSTRYNVIGSYLHGPILPKNPKLADNLLQLAVERKFGQTKLSAHDDKSVSELARLNKLALQARRVALNRPQ